MCDFSLQSVKSRAAKVGDKLITKNFGTGTSGFADVDDSAVAVCLLPGTELAFEEPARRMVVIPFVGYGAKAYDRVARFRQINLENRRTHHDALEFPAGETVLLTQLEEDQTATVLQLPAAPKNDAEVQEQRRLEVVG